jgi:hypothetical protein
VIDPVAGAWAESRPGSKQTNAKRAQEEGMRLVKLLDTPDELLCEFELTNYSRYPVYIRLEAP